MDGALKLEREQQHLEVAERGAALETVGFTRGAKGAGGARAEGSGRGAKRPADRESRDSLSVPP